MVVLGALHCVFVPDYMENSYICTGSIALFPNPFRMETTALCALRLSVGSINEA